jgi:hypothetical protein
MTAPHDMFTIISGTFGIIGTISEGEDFDARLREALQTNFTDITMLQKANTVPWVYSYYAKPLGREEAQWVAVTLEKTKLY